MDEKLDKYKGLTVPIFFDIARGVYCTATINVAGCGCDKCDECLFGTKHKEVFTKWLQLRNAAPDLLEAMKNWFECADEHDASCLCGRDGAKAAIAKAEANHAKSKI